MNHHYKLTTEELPYTAETAPKHLHSPSGLVTWCSEPSLAGCPDASESGDMPEKCMHEIQADITELYYQDCIYDYLTAVQGDINAKLPGTLAHLEPWDFTLKSSGVVYWGNLPTENDIGGLTCRLLLDMEDNIKSELWYSDIYDYIVALQGDLTVEGHPSLFDMEGFIVTAGGNALDTTAYGNVPALPYQAEECGMPLDSLAAMENYYNGLKEEDDLYDEYTIEMYLECSAGADQPGVSGVSSIEAEWGAIAEDAVNEPWWDDLSDLTDPVTFDTEPIRCPRINPVEFVSKLEEVDMSTIAPEDMRCLHCWIDFGKTVEETVEPRAGEIKADNGPVKMPCGPGHLIGKTCLMELIDAGVCLCPICKVDIVALAC